VFLLNNILSNLFIVLKKLKGSSASNYVIAQFQILQYLQQKTYTAVSLIMSQKCYLLAGLSDTYSHV